MGGGRKAGRLEGWKAGRLEGRKAGRLEGWKAGRLEGATRATGDYMRRLAVLLMFQAAFLGGIGGCSSDSAGPVGDVAGQDEAQDVGQDGVSGDQAAPLPETDAASEEGGATGYDLWLLDLDVQEVEPLSLYKVEPSKGKAVGGDQVVLSGSGFEDGMVVMFGHQKATDVYVLSKKKATAITPAGFPGPVDVELDNADGSKTVLPGGFLYFNPVAISAIDPSAGPVDGGVPIVVSGSGFKPGTALVIGDRIAIDVQVLDDSTLTAVTPPGEAGKTNVSVSSSDGLATLVGGFFYYEYPLIEEVSPAAGPASGGAAVLIRMKGAHEESQVMFGDKVAAQVSFVDFHTLEAITPPAEVGFVDVTVSTPYGADTREKGYFYHGGVSPPKDMLLVSVQPNSGPMSGGNEVQLTAFGLTDVQDTTVFFGSKTAVVKDVLPSLMLAFVIVPPGPEGKVDVTLMNSNGTSLLAGGYSWLPQAELFDVAPDHGPVQGGTKVVVSGKGFQPDAQVFFGALPGGQTKVLSGEQLVSTTPMGSPGPVDVTVLQAGTSASLESAFTYDGELALLVVDPNFGAVSGGTFIQLIGSGFKADAKVRVAGVDCSHVTLKSYNVLTAKTPPGVPGTFDVEVQVGDKVSVLPLSFTYYDPVSYYGGTWGGSVYHAVNVTVLDGDTGAPLPDAFVMLWANPDTPYQGYTDLLGQVTFSGPDLMGEQMVTASKECYSNSSVVEYDATNVTVYLKYNCPSMGSGTPPVFIPPIIKGRVWGFGKYVVIPPGPCMLQGGAFPFLCQPCNDNSNCGAANNICANLGDQGKKCLTACQNDTQCPLGFSCTSVQGGDEGGFGHCLPLGGQKMTFCSTSKGHFLGENPANGQGAIADQDGNFSLIVDHLGEVAVVCLGGVLPLCTSNWDCTFSDSSCQNNGCWMGDGRPEMTPYAIGVARHISLVKSGQVIEDVNLQMDIPMTKKITVFLDDPHLSWEGPNAFYGKAFVDFGSDGVFEFIEFPVKFYGEGDTTLPFEHLPTSLTGGLADATFAILAAAVTAAGSDSIKLPSTFALLTKLTQFDDDLMFFRGLEGWKATPSGVKTNLYDLWGPAWTDLFGVGMDGAIVHFNGNSWAPQQSPVAKTLRSIHGSDGLVWAVGDKGTIARFAGSKWEQFPYPKANNLRGVWSSSATNVMVAGDNTIDLWNGVEWKKMPGNSGYVFHGIWGANSSNVWAVGDYGKIVRLVNGQWVSQPSTTGHTLRDVWGSSINDVWAVGDSGTVVHFDGNQWNAVDSGVLVTLRTIFGFAPDDVFIVGANGTFLHFDGEKFSQEDATTTQQDILALFGSKETGLLIASGNHQLVLGPFVTPVTIVYPADGGVIDTNYLQWQFGPGGPDAGFHSVTLEQPSMMGPVLFWDFMADGDVTYVDLPDFPNISGTPGVPQGTYIYTIIRVYKEGFNIDNYDFMDMDYRTWRSWSWVQTSFKAQ